MEVLEAALPRAEREERALNQQLLATAYEGEPADVERLVKEGGSVDALDQHRQPALSIAASKGHTEMVSLMVRLGADVEAKGRHGWGRAAACAQPRCQSAAPRSPSDDITPGRPGITSPFPIEELLAL